MAVTTGPVYVPAPNPVVPRYGLFSVATGPLDIPIQARNGGVQYQISVCDLPELYEVNCQEDHETKVIESGVTTVTGAPFVVYSAIRCSLVGLVNQGEEAVRRYLFDQLVAGEQGVVERAFSTGAVGLLPSLVGATDLGAAQGPVQAVGILESWLYARYGLPGVIHAPMLAAPYFSGAHIIERDGSAAAPIWKTAVGTKVSFGDYAGTGPTGQVPGTGDTWIYITGQVAIWRTPDSEVLVPPMNQVITTATNLITTVMEREYVLTYDCYAAAVQVTLDTTDQ